MLPYFGYTAKSCLHEHRNHCDHVNASFWCSWPDSVVLRALLQAEPGVVCDHVDGGNTLVIFGRATSDTCAPGCAQRPVEVIAKST